MSLSHSSKRRALRDQLSTLVVQVDRLSLSTCFGTVASNDDKSSATRNHGFKFHRPDHATWRFVPLKPFSDFIERPPAVKPYSLVRLRGRHR